jgi:hypothetical protein
MPAPVAVPTPTLVPQGPLTDPRTGRTLATPTVRRSRLKAGRKARTTRYGKASSREAAISVTLARPAVLKLTAVRVVAGRSKRVKGATVKLPARSGAVTIRITARFGKAKLSAGLYRVTLMARGPGGAEHQTVLVRVVR